MIITGKHLSRRTILRGLGASVALPILDAMTPALAAPTTNPTRVIFTYVPNGMMMADWTPAAVGADYELTPILKPFEPFRKDMLVISGLADHNGNALGDGGGDHARAGGSFLTGVHPLKTAGKDIHVGKSADQYIADGIGTATRISSLELGCEDSRVVGNCDSGYSCAYSNSLSWRGPSTPNPPVTNPRSVFERLFGSEDITLSAEERARRRADRKSILDMVQSDLASLKVSLGGTDKRKMDEYLTAVREIEQKITLAEKQKMIEVTPDFEKPVGAPFNYEEYVNLMLGMAKIALQTDMTRVVTVVYAREGSVRAYPEIEISDGHHPISHHGNQPDKLAKLSLINQYHTKIFAEFLAKMRATPDGDGSLLDHSLVLYGSGLSDSNRHLHENLPILLFGRGDGSVKPGRHIQVAEKTPICNLYRTLAQKAGVNVDQIGDSTGLLPDITQVS